MTAAKHRPLRTDVARLPEFFPNPNARTGRDLDVLNWPNAPDMAKRYETLLSAVEFSAYSKERPLKLLDIGCGLGLLLDYLAENDLLQRVDYTGVDLVEPILREVRRRWPGQRFDQRDVRDEPYDEGAFDFCVICGIFTVKHGNSHGAALALAQSTLEAIWPSVNLGLAFNAMSKHVDWERDDLFHWPLDDIMAFCKQRLSRHVAFNLDYGLWEVSTLVRKAPRPGLSKIPPQW
jgi:SAM-dependent methyltransferase